jgi:UDP-glucose 4-epimerase
VRVLVTGGAGFVGANVCTALAARPEVERITVLDDLSSGDLVNLGGVQVDFVLGSILDRALLADLVADATTVIHLAARPLVPGSVAEPMRWHTINATGTRNVLEACREARPQVILALSSSVYDGVKEPHRHVDPGTGPLASPSDSTMADEAHAIAYATTHALPLLAFRFFNLYGPMQPADHAHAAVIPAFVSAALLGHPLPIHGDGRQCRDFTYVESVAEVVVDAVLRRVTSTNPVNLAFGTRVSLLELVDALTAVLGRPVEMAFIPARSGDVREPLSSPGLLHKLFPDARAISLEDGLRRTVAWFEMTLGSRLHSSGELNAGI